MHPRELDIDGLYLDRVQQLRPPQTVWDRLQEPSVLISGALIIFTVVYHTWGYSTALGELTNRVCVALWDILVFLTPLPLIRFIDSWVNSSQPMSDATADANGTKSDMMRKALGLDRAQGMMSSVFQARTRALSITGSALGFKLDSDPRPPGLGNRDNSCFQNSILQGLASLPTFSTYLSTCVQDANVDDPNSRVVTQTLRALISDLNDASNNGRTLWTPNTLKFMSTWTQQDAQEYYSKILDDIDKGAAKTLKALNLQHGFEADNGKDDTSSSQLSDDSGYQSLQGGLKSMDRGAFRNPLEGLLAQRVSCVQCGYSEGLSMIPFNCLTLSLSLDRRVHDLYERLDAYSEIEFIPGVECPKCTLLKAQRLLSKLVERLREDKVSDEKLAEPLRRLQAVETALEEDLFDDKTMKEDCKISPQSKVSATKTKQVVIARPPQSLAIHINRSVFDPNTFNTVKNSAPVEFPPTLDLGAWCLGSAESKDSPNGPPAQAAADCDEKKDPQEQWPQHPTASMIAGDLKPSWQSGPIYELRAVVTHQGRHENGHYICYKKHPDAGKADPEPSEADSGFGGSQDGDNDAQATPGVESEPSWVAKCTRNDWWRLSDHNVSKVDEDVIASLAPGVFMLFYECVEPNMVVQEPLGNSTDATPEDVFEAASDEPPPYAEPAKDSESIESGATQSVPHEAGSRAIPPEPVTLTTRTKSD